MPRVVWKDVGTGADLVPPIETTQSEVDALVSKIEIGEEFWLRRTDLKKLNLVVLAIDTVEGVTTLSTQPV